MSPRTLAFPRGTGMKTTRPFSDEILAVLEKSKSLRTRAGRGRHRFIGIWFVVVKDRLFVRSWSVKPDGWYRAFLKDRRGAVQVAKFRITVFAKSIDESLRDAIDRAYVKRYNTRGALNYAKDLGSANSRATTLELVLVPAR
jgi:hypothetical protein